MVGREMVRWGKGFGYSNLRGVGSTRICGLISQNLYQGISVVPHDLHQTYLT